MLDIKALNKHNTVNYTVFNQRIYKNRTSYQESQLVVYACNLTPKKWRQKGHQFEVTLFCLCGKFEKSLRSVSKTTPKDSGMIRSGITKTKPQFIIY